MNRREILGILATLPLIDTVSVASASGGKAIDLSAHQGKVILVDFWASWCGPCRQSFPWLNIMSAKYQDKGLHIIGVNLDADSSAAKQFISEFPAQFEIQYDPEGEHARFYDLKAMPSSLLFDREGNLSSRHNGFLTDQIAEYEARLIALING